MARRTEAQIEVMARARWEAARHAFEAGNKQVGWVHLLAMGCCMAAITREPLKDDLAKIARAGGLIP